MTFATKRILIADGQPLCRTGLAAMFSRDLDITEIREAGDFAATLAALARDPGIGLVTVDLALPGMRGGEGLRRLRMDRSELLLVVVASTRDRDLVLDALCAGVHGYVPKDMLAEEMLNAFRAVLSGQIFVPALVSDISEKWVEPTIPRTATTDLCLTGRQLDVLRHLSAGKSNKEIARILHIAESTVKVHITAAFRALGVHNRVSAAAAMQSRPLTEFSSEAFIPGLLREERIERRGRVPDNGAWPPPALAN